MLYQFSTCGGLKFKILFAIWEYQFFSKEKKGLGEISPFVTRGKATRDSWGILFFTTCGFATAWWKIQSLFLLGKGLGHFSCFQNSCQWGLHHFSIFIWSAGDLKPNTKHQMSAKVVFCHFNLRRRQPVLFSFQIETTTKIFSWHLEFGF